MYSAIVPSLADTVTVLGGSATGVMFGSVANAIQWKANRSLGFGTNPTNSVVTTALLGAVISVGGLFLLWLSMQLKQPVPYGYLTTCIVTSLSVWLLSMVVAPRSNAGPRLSSLIVIVLLGASCALGSAVTLAGVRYLSYGML